MKKFAVSISRRTRSVAFGGLLSALALALSALEMLIPPLPMLPPGAKLGLSNIVTMYTADAMGLGPALTISLLKALFAGITRGFTAFLMSLAGGICSTFVVWLLLRCKKHPFGCIGVGVVGALTHNFAQLVVAGLLTSFAVVAYIPWLILFGIATGIATGLVLKLVIPALNRLKL